MLQCVAVALKAERVDIKMCTICQYKGMLQCVAECRSVLQCVAVALIAHLVHIEMCAVCQYKGVLQCVQCFAVCCGVLQCVAVCCCVLQ